MTGIGRIMSFWVAVLCIVLFAVPVGAQMSKEPLLKPEDPFPVVMSPDELTANSNEPFGCSAGDLASCSPGTVPGNADGSPDAGDVITFSATDLNGIPLTSDILFSGYKVTMVNVWSTTCGYCVKELPALARLNTEFNSKNARIIGVVYNADAPDLVQEAQEIVEDLNVDYVNLLPNPEIRSIFQAQSFPITFFVDRNGKVLGEPVMGALINKYAELVDLYLQSAE